jgi:hypothetical protein
LSRFVGGDHLAVNYRILDVKLGCQLITERIDDPNWLFDLKYDGFRALYYIEPGRSRLISAMVPQCVGEELLSRARASSRGIHILTLNAASRAWMGRQARLKRRPDQRQLPVVAAAPAAE